MIKGEEKKKVLPSALLRIAEPAHEQYQSRLVIGYHEDEGMIGQE